MSIPAICESLFSVVVLHRSMVCLEEVSCLPLVDVNSALYDTYSV